MYNFKNLNLGKLGEDIACNFLKSKGYKIISRNFKKPFGEIDIITKKNNILIFFEVKTLKENKIGFCPEDQMTQRKIKRLKKICQYFVLNNSELIHDKYGWQIDLIAIYINNKNNYTIKHYENI
ncbi:MAG: YraN family protein [Patescibacteria group bacterium]|nr:YraN family protein [Patescibacteria group bacterium]